MRIIVSPEGEKLSNNTKYRKSAAPIYGFAIAWLVLSAILPLYRMWGLICAFAICSLVSYALGRADAKKRAKLREEELKAAAEEAKRNPPKKSYGEKVDAIVDEGNRALSEMGRLYQSIKDPVVRGKINEIMRITDKIIQDAIADPSDVPQIKKFMSYYLPTTIKLLNTYDRMGQQGIEGENIDKTMGSINEMLDTAIEAYKKRLDALFADQSLDIETDISVMNTMLEREGLAGSADFKSTSN